MNKIQIERMEQMISSTFGFNAAQHNRFIMSDQYLDLIQLAHKDNWASLEVKMNDKNYFLPDGPTVINIDGPNYGAIQM
jgi:hypothetical protein